MNWCTYFMCMYLPSSPPPLSMPLPLPAHTQIAAVKAPGFGENRKANLADIAALTGGEVISEELGLKIEKLELTSLGRWGLGLRGGEIRGVGFEVQLKCSPAVTQHLSFSSPASAALLPLPQPPHLRYSLHTSPHSAKRVTLTKYDTIVLHGGGGRPAIQERCDSIRQAIESSTSDYDRCEGLALLSPTRRC